MSAAAAAVQRWVVRNRGKKWLIFEHRPVLVVLTCTILVVLGRRVVHLPTSQMLQLNYPCLQTHLAYCIVVTPFLPRLEKLLLLKTVEDPGRASDASFTDVLSWWLCLEMLRWTLSNIPNVSWRIADRTGYYFFLSNIIWLGNHFVYYVLLLLLIMMSGRACLDYFMDAV